MGVQLESIAFNYDSSAHSNDALNIRRNATQAVTVPEWRSGVSVTADDSPAAYSLADVQGNMVSIQVELRRTDPTPDCVEVRALDINAAGGCLYLILVALGLGKFIKPGPRSLLGAVRSQCVCFGSNNLTGPVLFNLTHHRLNSAGVENSITMWRWQYRVLPFGAWQDFGITQHRTFAVLHAPTAPWQQMPSGSGNTQLPYVDLLKYVCTWAKGAHTANGAAAAVTKAIYAFP